MSVIAVVCSRYAARPRLNKGLLADAPVTWLPLVGHGLLAALNRDTFHDWALDSFRKADFKSLELQLVHQTYVGIMDARDRECRLC
jgi:hypothetical protein